MIRLYGLCLVGCALCVTPGAADEDVYDGPTAIKPLAVDSPQPQHSAPPHTVCDFEHQCYPENGGPVVKAPAAPPGVVAKPAAPRPQVPDEPIVATWRDCMGRACRTTSSRTTSTPGTATGSCQVRLEERDGEDYAGAEPPTPLAAPQANGRRNIGCGWWPIGSDADRDCAARDRRF